MKKKIKIFLLGVLLILNLQAIAQEFYISNNSEVKALASKKEITRIAFDTPVAEVHAISEEIEYVINGKDIYLRMLNEDKPINFFVKCEDESTYKLLLIAQDAPADQIFIHNKLSKIGGLRASSKTEYFGQISPELKTRIAKIIELSLTPTTHLNYQYQNKDVNLFILNKNLKANLESLVSGNQLIAEKVRLINKSEQSIKLDLRDFADSKYLAVYLHNKEIPPKQEAVLIRVLENQ
jgi:hypothetical protein